MRAVRRRIGRCGGTVKTYVLRLGGARPAQRLSSTGFDGHWELPLSGLLGQGCASLQVLELDRRETPPQVQDEGR